MEKPNKEILCTLGPASLNDHVLARLEDLGVSLLRINLSHTKLEDISDVIQYVQNRVSVPVCLDTEGAQIRTGDLPKGKVILQENNTVYVHRQLVFPDTYNINFYPPDIIDLLAVGDFISIDFNSVLAQVISRESNRLLLRILTGGTVSQNKAVNVLDRDVKMPVLTKKDQKALKIGADLGINHVALSFANQSSDVDELRKLLATETFVISKIESINGFMNIEEIASKSDALLIDRGDLSREVNIEKIPILQKKIIQYAKKSGVKIYVATNLLESMVTAPIPTRAEINDIFNTLNDGADGLVLAAETAIGSYPVDCVKMVSKMIHQLAELPHGFSTKELRRKGSFLMVEPHGGALVDRMNGHFDIKKTKPLRVDQTVLLNAEQIALGTFSPLEGFMNQKEVESVLHDYHLPNGIVWPLPIILQVSKETASELKKGDTIALILENTDDAYAILNLEDVYSYDLDEMCLGTFGTNDSRHPGVQLLKKRGGFFLGGGIELIKRLPSEYKCYELTPRQARTIFGNKGWSKVVGFHTRNVIHRAHEHIQMTALKDYYCDGLFVHPVVGPKKRGDYNADVILKSYELMLNHHYPKGKVLLGAFQNYARYSGPREAVFTALCRKNFGCSHFIIGRDHTGVGNYYEPDAAEKLFEKLGNIDIIPIFFNEQYYCNHCKTYVEQCEHGKDYYLNIRGTEGRRILESKKYPPEWFMRRDVSKLILDELKDGKNVFVK